MTPAELYEVIKLSVPEIFGAMKDIVVMVASVAGICVAFMGLSTWKRQIKGQTEYSLAKETLINTYKLRDEIIRVRSPFMAINEQPSPPEEKAKEMTPDEIRFYGLREAYFKRFEKAVSAKSALLVNLTEAEALWGLDLKKLSEEYFKHERHLLSSINFYLALTDPKIDKLTKEASRKEQQSARKIVFDSLNEDDDYNKKLNESIKPIEEYLRKKMAK